MFTGLIQKVGRVVKVERAGKNGVITIAHDPWDEVLTLGESVAVQGICLTVVRSDLNQFVCDLLGETLKRTNLAAASRGTPVNLERALRASDRIGGHFVTGHADGTGEVVRLEKIGSDWMLGIECHPDLVHGIAMKGSIACDGVSLTVTALSPVGFEVNLIPFTWQNTSLNRLKIGGAVNLETDLIGKHVRRFIEGRDSSSRITWDKLHKAGFG